jgi:hypothetical protein
VCRNGFRERPHVFKHHNDRRREQPAMADLNEAQHRSASAFPMRCTSAISLLLLSIADIHSSKGACHYHAPQGIQSPQAWTYSCRDRPALLNIWNCSSADNAALATATPDPCQEVIMRRPTCLVNYCIFSALLSLFKLPAPQDALLDPMTKKRVSNLSSSQIGGLPPQCRH